MDIVTRSTLFVDPLIAAGDYITHPKSSKSFARVFEPVFVTNQHDGSLCSEKFDIHGISIPINLQRVENDIFDFKFKNIKKVSHYCSGTLIYIKTGFFVVTCLHNISNAVTDSIKCKIKGIQQELTLYPNFIIPEYDIVLLTPGRDISNCNKTTH